jgi:hypothetical protein
LKLTRIKSLSTLHMIISTGHHRKRAELCWLGQSVSSHNLRRAKTRSRCICFCITSLHINVLALYADSTNHHPQIQPLGKLARSCQVPDLLGFGVVCFSYFSLYAGTVIPTYHLPPKPTTPYGAAQPRRSRTRAEAVRVMVVWYMYVRM